MSDLKQLINREIDRKKFKIRGRVATDPVQVNFDPGGGQFLQWCCSVIVENGSKVLENVPIKINGPKARFYCRVDAPVFLERNEQGRYQVTAPADRAMRSGAVALLDEDDDTVIDGGSEGFTVVREPFEFYKGVTPESFFDPGADAATLLWLRGYDRLTGLPDNIIPVTDTDGAEIVQVDDKSGNGNDAGPQLTAADRPLYRRFDGTGGNTNLRSSIDFDGVTDVLDLVANVVESTPGQISIFGLVDKEAVGAGADNIVSLANWDLLSRGTFGNFWGFDAGAGDQSSGSALDSDYVLIELVASAFDNVVLFQDGTFLTTITTAAAGLGNPSSHLGNSSGGANAHNGRIVELLVMDEAVSGTKRVAIEAYFNQTIFVPFSRWANGIDGFPKIRVLDSDGVEVSV